MPRLNFKAQFQDAIRNGRKTTTLRRWKTCRLAAGDRVYSAGIGWLRIGGCEPIELHQLKDADARSDGFSSLAELHVVLKQIYPNQKGDGKRWFRVAFAVEEGEIAAGASRESKRTAAAAPKQRRRLGGDAKVRLAQRVRAELDNAVRRSGSLLPL